MMHEENKRKLHEHSHEAKVDHRSSSARPDDFEQIVLFAFAGIIITKYVDRSGRTRAVNKCGSRVREAEYKAMNLVDEQNRELDCDHIPIPRPMHYVWNEKAGWGELFMRFVEGTDLEKVWNHLEKADKLRLCKDTWTYVDRIHQIPKPSTALFAYDLSGSPSRDILLTEMGMPGEPITDDKQLISRIILRYKLHNKGREDNIEALLAKVPTSQAVVFSHGDIAPRNIMVRKDDHHKWQIVAIMDWEAAGSFPEWWDFACMMRGPTNDKDWMHLMHQTAPTHLTCDVEGIRKAFHRIM